MTRAKKDKKTDVVEGQTDIFEEIEKIVNSEQQTEQNQSGAEEMATAADIIKAHVGRPLKDKAEKKIQIKLYTKSVTKGFFEDVARSYGKTSSQFFEIVANKIIDLYYEDREKLSEFVDCEQVSKEHQKALEEREHKRKNHGLTIKSLNFNHLRKIQFSKGKFSPAEIVECYAFFSLEYDGDDNLDMAFRKFLEKKFRLDEAMKMIDYVDKFCKRYSEWHTANMFDVKKNLWKIPDFYCEKFYTIKINSKAKKMTMSDQNNLYEVLFEE